MDVRSCRMCTLLLLVLCLLAPGCRGEPGAEAPPEEGAPPPTVLLISLDGFHWEYADRYETPALDRLAQCGVRAERLLPVFPTKTFPNHYSLVTGLYPEHHGIVANNMYDPAMDASFSLGDRAAVEDPRWWGGEPLWVTAEKQGQIAATYFWPGSEAPIQGVRPTHWKRYDSSVGGETRVAQVLEWLSLPADERPTFVTLYFSEVDGAGHRYGPHAEETAAAVRTVNAHLNQLLDGLEERGLMEMVDVIVTSDHGMTPTSPERVILLDDYINLDDVRIIDRHPVVMLYAEEGREEAVYRQLSEAPHLTVYRKEEVPERLHFSNHPRIPPLIGIAEEGWTITTRASYEENPDRYRGGAHGYDNRLASMHGIFYACGPAFRTNATVAPFSSVHLYELMAEILGLEPAPNDGSLDSVRVLLKRPAEEQLAP